MQTSDSFISKCFHMRTLLEHIWIYINYESALNIIDTNEFEIHYSYIATYSKRKKKSQGAVFIVY